MPGFTITNGVTFSSGFRFSADPEPITATAGPITSVSGSTGTAITSFFPFASVQNGVAPYTYFVSAGVLPTGLSLNSSTGLVTGTPTVAQGASNVTFTVRDSNNVLASTTSIVSFDVVLSPSYTIQYLIVGGGGAGGTNGGGGGGGGGVLTGCATVNLTTSYTITVGGGGTGKPAGPACASFNSTNGSPSFICGTGVSLVGIGGGYGGNYLNCNPGKPGGPGGSGGGAAGWNSPSQTVSNFGTGTPGQGFPGGSIISGGCGSPGGGGGGAGGQAPQTTPTRAGMAGGIGYTWPLNGLGYGGGGGGGASRQPADPTAVGGNMPGNPSGTAAVPFGGGGGGGSRALPAPLIPANPVNGSPGTNGRGGGGGGSSIAPSPGINSAGSGNGGSGTVILAVPNDRYPTISAPGAAVSTPGSAPGKTVLTYTAASPLTPSTFTFTA